MNILTYQSDVRFSNCPQAFLVTGTPENDQFNRSLLKENQTGHWIVKTGRVQPGDAIFLILPSLLTAGGYPRELLGGVIEDLKVNVDERKTFRVTKFFRLPSIESDVKDFLVGRVPPQGNKVLQIWKQSKPISVIEKSLVEAIRRSSKDSAAARLARLKTAPKRPLKVSATVEVFVRNPDVVAEVLFRAGGVCGGCGADAPFVRRSDNLPYLEVHHITQLADGGEDTVSNAIAVCPNCHRKAHFGKSDA